MSDPVRRVLLTGATGFLGRRLVPKLLAQGHTVRVLVRREDDGLTLREQLHEGLRERLEIASGGYTRRESAAAALEGCQVVFHLAAALSGSPAGMVQTTVTGTRALLDAVAERPVERFVLVSSLAVYDTSRLLPGDQLSEQCPLESRPGRRDPYCYSKVLQEQICWQAHREQGLPLVVVRPGVLYGPVRGGMSSRVGLRFGNVVLQMGGSHRLPYCYVENCAAALARAGSAPNLVGQAMNLVDDELPTGRQIVREYRRHVGRLWSIWIPLWTLDPLARGCQWYHRWSQGQLPAVITRTDYESLWKPLRYDNRLAKKLLDWQPEVPLAEALRRTFAVPN